MSDLPKLARHHLQTSYITNRMLNRILVTTLDGFVVEMSAPESFWTWDVTQRAQWLTANFGVNGWKEMAPRRGHILHARAGREFNHHAPALSPTDEALMRSCFGRRRIELAHLNIDDFIREIRGGDEDEPNRAGFEVIDVLQHSEPPGWPSRELMEQADKEQFLVLRDPIAESFAEVPGAEGQETQE